MTQLPDVAILTAAVTAAALGAVHLWKTLFAKHKENPRDPEPASESGSSPRRRGPYTTASANGSDSYENGGNRSR